MSRNDFRIEPAAATPPALQPGAAIAAESTAPRWRLVGIGAMIVTAVIIGLLLGRRQIAPLRQEIASQASHMQVQQKTIANQASQVKALQGQLEQLRTTCDDAGQEQAQVQNFLSRGQTALAVGLAELKLAQQNPPLCAAAKSALAGFWYRASIDDLFSTSHPDSTPPEVDQQLIARWEDIESKANSVYAVPKDQLVSPFSLAVRSYASARWALADAAYRKAWAEGLAGPSSIGFRYDLLRNYGYNLAHKGPANQKQAGVQILGTAQAIASRYSLPKHEACQDLQDLGYKDCRAVQPDPLEPTLIAVTH